MIARTLQLALCVLLLGAVGCGGCRKEDDLEAKKRAEELRKQKLAEEQQPDFEPARVCILPASMPADNFAPESESTPQTESTSSISRSVAVKPGHWVECWHYLRSNKRDFTGRLNLSWVDRDRDPRMLERSTFQLVSSRSLALPKGQPKLVDATSFVVPPHADQESRRLQLRMRLENRSGTGEMDDAFPATRLRPHQYYIVVLAANPERYGFLRLLPSVQPPIPSWNFTGIDEDYLVVTPNPSQKIPLPQNALAWTSIAYIIVDDFDADALSESQKTAMIDWLHWGGQLIVSGPRSLERLQRSFLEPYLPSRLVGTQLITREQVDALNEVWARVPRKARQAADSYRFPHSEKQPLEVLRLKPESDSRFLASTAETVATKRVGRGTVVMSAFALTDSRVVNWRCLDNFFNACLLQRPPRKFDQGRAIDFTGWVFGDSRVRTALRFFSRDAWFPDESRALHRRPLDGDGPQQPPLVLGLAAPVGDPASGGTQKATDPDSGAWEITTQPELAGFAHDHISGVAGWNDFSSAANAARSALVHAAGISVPDKKFISTILIAYLVCLVPLNWLVFRLLGRVEWAWFAAPVIAILGAVAVVQLAQLDIGFARSQTDIAIVEMQSDYPRAHVTTFSGLYSSLTTRYAAELDEQTARILPFSMAPSDQQLSLRQPEEVRLDDDRKVELSGYPVYSNSTGMLHAEQMLQLPGVFTISESRDGLIIGNGTGFNLRSVIVLARQGLRCQLAVNAQFADGASWQVKLNEDSAQAFFEMLESHPVTAANVPLGELSLRRLVQLATDGRQLEDGQLRLIGWTDQPACQAAMSPQANQRASQTLVVANLRYDVERMPKPDINSVEDFDIDQFLEVP